MWGLMGGGMQRVNRKIASSNFLSVTQHVDDGIDGEFPIRVILHLAFPDDAHTPSHLEQPIYAPAIPGDIGGELRLPETGRGLRRCRMSTSAMAMPEAAVDENGKHSTAENNVRPSRQVLGMQAVANASGTQCTAELDLRQCVLASYAGHHLGTAEGLASACWHPAQIERPSDRRIPRLAIKGD